MKIFKQETKVKYRFDRLEDAMNLMDKLYRFGFKYETKIERDEQKTMYAVYFQATKREVSMLEKIEV